MADTITHAALREAVARAILGRQALDVAWEDWCEETQADGLAQADAALAAIAASIGVATADGSPEWSRRVQALLRALAEAGEART